MPWLIKNEDVVRLEPQRNPTKKKQNDGKHHSKDATTITTITTPHTSTSTIVVNSASSTDAATATASSPLAAPAAASTTTTPSSPSSSSGPSLFFIHVPRCGGTSLMHYYQLPHKIYTHYRYNYWKRLGMYAFFSRYKTLEQYNFPIWTSGNGFAVMIMILGIYFLLDTKNNYMPYNLGILLILFGVTLFILLTIIFTAPVIGRFPFIHHAYLIFVHYILCQFMECTTYCTGTNKAGYIMHLTAHKLLHTYQYVTVPQWNISCSMAIIRNPYSRMISIYTYNRFGEWESFSHFIQDWYHNVCKYYRADRICDEWYTPCHAIPQFEYTHYNGTQLVKSIIKQEELKYLKDIYKTNLTATATAASTTMLNNAYNNVNRESDSESNGSSHGNGGMDGNIVHDIENTVTGLSLTLSKEEPTMTATGEDTAETGHSSSTIVTSTIESNTSLNSHHTTGTTTTTAGKSTSIQNLPDTVRDALIHMPHSNQRLLSQGKWYDYYTQETLNLVYEIYHEDFNYFHYNPILVQRPDLEPPLLYHELYQPRSRDTTYVPVPTSTTTTNDDDIELGHTTNTNINNPLQ